jgi:hypothetical protein
MDPREEIELLNRLLDELLAGIQEILLSGERISDELQGMIAEEMEITLQRIEQLREEESDVDRITGGQTIREPPINPPPGGLTSSNVNSFGYDDKTGRLLVKFQGDYPQQNGPVYAYGGVPKQIFDLFKTGAVPARTDGKNKWGRWFRGKVPSLGASLFTLIKNGGYSYTRLS